MEQFSSLVSIGMATAGDPNCTSNREGERRRKTEKERDYVARSNVNNCKQPETSCPEGKHMMLTEGGQQMNTVQKQYSSMVGRFKVFSSHQRMVVRRCR